MYGKLPLRSPRTARSHQYIVDCGKAVDGVVVVEHLLNYSAQCAERVLVIMPLLQRILQHDWPGVFVSY